MQRRPASEWEHLVHFHLGQYPTAEYQALGRDRDWFGTALKEMVPELASKLPLESEAWKQWQAQRAAGGEGRVEHERPHERPWRLLGRDEGRGGQRQDRYTLAFDGRWDDGRPMQGKGQALIYTGYEWRGDLVVDGTPMRQVFAVEDGVMRGRMFMRDQDEVGADVVASLQGAGNSRVLAVHPSYLKAGESAELRIVGSGLAGDVTLPAGVKLIDTVKRSATEVVVRVQADAAARGVHPVAVGKVSGGALALYDSVAAVKVLPAFAVARIGGNGTPTAKVEARFDAEAWAAGADGKAGTEDDFRIGVMPAKWSVEPFNEVAAHDQDVKFAGLMDAASGVFVPGDAGPNPARRMSASNVGNLKVVAEVEQGGERLRGEGQVIVAPPRWNNPPLP
ncbi:quinohemoprotein amine dehydrogenase subunit alpha [Thauera humireducens]|uniref:quinohemoprotein amine dehydrogenase subunit alpha n=1 Tax=Thauera humireducens TaxID=1134435 RepID=UPI00311EAF90